MPLPLHKIVGRNDALSALGGGSQFRVVRGGEFVTFPACVVCFLDRQTLNFQSPTSIEWKPGSNREQPPWLLVPARAPSPKYRLLIAEETGYYNVGEAHLGCYSMDGSMARFTLSVRLPRTDWGRFGGFPHWKITVNHEEHRVSSGDEQSLRSLLDQAITKPYSHLAMTRYEEDSLDLFMNKERGWLMYLREPGDSGLCVSAAGDEDDAKEHFRCDCGIDLEFPRSRTLTLEKAVDVVTAFFQSGALPELVSWDDQ